MTGRLGPPLLSLNFNQALRGRALYQAERSGSSSWPGARNAPSKGRIDCSIQKPMPPTLSLPRGRRP
jgi:hypothetical protein